MKILYFDCGMGAAGDMLMAALLELTGRQEEFLQTMNGLNLPGVCFSAEKSEKCGIVGTHMRIRVGGHEEGVHDHAPGQEHHHAHRNMAEIRGMIASLPLPGEVRANAARVYETIAAAESHVHGVPVEQVHFHEVGTMDAVADVVGVCLLMHWLKPDRVCASAVHVGAGQVRCAHGLLPVPAPATAWILRDVPIYGGEIAGELCPPTGAALLKTFVSEFGRMPMMRPGKIGYGMGTRDFPAANCLRAILGSSGDSGDEITELRCNLDDMTPEAVGFAMEALLSAGALDVFTTPIGMKKSRPGVMLTCLCRPEKQETLTALLFRHTTTLGVREIRCRRQTLERSVRETVTPYGTVRVKHAEGWGVVREKPEFEDLAAIARATGNSLEKIQETIV